MQKCVFEAQQKAGCDFSCLRLKRAIILMCSGDNDALLCTNLLDIEELVAAIGAKVCGILLGLPAYTGCSAVRTFAGKRGSEGPILYTLSIADAATTQTPYTCPVDMLDGIGRQSSQKGGAQAESMEDNSWTKQRSARSGEKAG